MAWSIFDQGGGNAAATAWAEAELKTIGAPVSPNNVQFMYDWERSEGGGGKFNPLNQGPVPGQPGLTTTGSQYGGGAADFASWDAGLQGAADYLHMSSYRSVLQDLMQGAAPQQTASDLWRSPWAASHYGNGANWYGGAPQGGGSVPPELAALTAGVPAGAAAGVSGGGGGGGAAGRPPTAQTVGLSLNPADWVASALTGLNDLFANAVLRLMIGVFGAIVLIVGLSLLAKGAGADVQLVSSPGARKAADGGDDEATPSQPSQAPRTSTTTVFGGRQPRTRFERNVADMKERGPSPSRGMAGEAESAAEVMA